MSRWWQPGRGEHWASLSCDSVRDAISARLDSEHSGAGSKPVDAHLATCEYCQRFEAEATALTRQAGLQASRPAPDALKSLLAAELAQTVGPPSPRATRRAPQVRPAIGLRHSARWAGALAPAAVVAIAIPLGALRGPMGHPTHPKTPCTVHLTSHVSHVRDDHTRSTLPRDASPPI